LKLSTTRTYLGDGQVSQVAFDGTGSSEGTDTLDLTYDAAGRPDQVKRSSVVLTDYAWNPDGTLASRLDETIGTTTFAFDWADRPVTTDPPDTYASGTIGQTWRLDGLLATKSWPTGITATASYDAARRPIGLSFGTAGSVGQAFDRDGNVTAETHTLTGVSGAAGTGTQSFTYDPLNRVTGSSGLTGLTRSYTYDLDGNRLTKTENGTTTYTATFEPTDQARTIQKTGGSLLTFGYDQYGNLTSDVGDGVNAIGYGYDIAGRLTSIDAPGTTNDASFAIDAAGRFKSRTIAGVTDTYAYEGLTETVTRIVNASPVDSLVDATGGRLGVKVGATVNWFLPDPHGNIAGALSGTTVASALRYDPYGTTIATGSAGGSPVATGHWKHQARLDISPPGLASPLYEAGARLYSPGLGAFTSLDTLMGTTQDPLSLNRFLYAQANPATLIDPTGHFVCESDSDCNRLGDNPNNKPPAPPPPPSGDAGDGEITDADDGDDQDNVVEDPGNFTFVAGVLVGPNGVPLTKEDLEKLGARCDPFLRSTDEACRAYLAGIRAFKEAEAAYCHENPDICAERNQESFYTLVMGVELIVTIGTIFDPVPGDEAVAAGATGGTWAALQRIKDRLASLVGRGGRPLPSGPPRFGPWTRTEVLGSRVYQRNDLIDPTRIDKQSGLTNLELMRLGRAPNGPDNQRINLHHALQTMDGPIVELTQTMHLGRGTRGVVHINPPTIPSGIDEAAFARWRSEYWKIRACDFGGC
jgi:RHS repeat-associated protein